MSLTGPNGLEQIKVVPAEGGMLAFITPESPLMPGGTYSVTINGASDQTGLLLPISGFSFTTESTKSQASSQTDSKPESTDSKSGSENPKSEIQNPKWDEDWEWRGALKDGKPHSSWQDLPPLEAETGVTALAGQVLTLKGEPLANVTLVMELYGDKKITAQTDDTGRFLLKYIYSSWREFIIDGRSAGPNPKSKIENQKWNYGVFEVGVEIKKGETNVLPYTIWMPRIDTAHAVKIASPTTAEVVVTNPHVPGLELRLAPGTVIHDHEGNTVTEVSITPIPVDRPPFPLATNIDVPLYFTAQPGAAYVYSSSGIGARIVLSESLNSASGSAL